MGITFNKGNKINGNKAVTAIFTVSVIHQMTIQVATAITASPFSETKVNGENWIKKNNSGPNNKPIFLVDCIVVILSKIKHFNK